MTMPKHHTASASPIDWTPTGLIWKTDCTVRHDGRYWQLTGMLPAFMQAIPPGDRNRMWEDMGPVPPRYELPDVAARVVHHDDLPEGFANWNRRPHLLVDVPDGGFTISCRTSQGKRVTFSFEVYKAGGPPQFVDVAYHDNGTHRTKDRSQPIPTFDVLALSGGRTPYDSRQATPDGEDKPGIVCILIEDPKESQPA